MNYGYLKILLLVLGAIAFAGSAFNILKEYERAVVFRLGKYSATKGPGLVLLIPLIDRIIRVDLRLVSIDVPRQDIMTKDNVPVTVDAVVYFQILDPAKAIISIKDIYQSTFLLAQGSLRSVLGQVELDDLLSQQANINEQLQRIITIHTKQWGISISNVEIKEVTLPEMMKRAMAKQAETERERRARLIDAQGEFQASKTLAEAGAILSQSPQAIQLRYLQTLRDISTNKGSTVLFPFPIDFLRPFVDGVKRVFQPQEAPDKAQPEIGKELGKNTFQPDRQKVSIEKKADTEKAAAKQKEGASIEAAIHDQIALYKRGLQEGKLRPQYVQWVITDTCQFQCSHCETTITRGKHKELTTEEAKRVMDGLSEIGCGFLSLTGGEPLLRKDLFDLVAYGKGLGLRIGLTTNGQAVEEYLQPLADAHFDSIVVTLDGYGDKQNRIMNAPDAYERGIKGIEFFHDVGVPRIGVSTILLSDNLKELPRLTEDVFRAGATIMQIQPLLFNNGEPARNPSEIVKDVFRFILEARRRGFAVEAGESFGYIGPLEGLLRTAPFMCECGWNTFCIDSRGRVLACPVLSREGIAEGDCTIDTLKEIWQKGFSSFRSDIPEDLPEGCRRCPHLSACRGGCWLFRVQGLNPCFLLEAEQVYQEITNAAIYTQAP